MPRLHQHCNTKYSVLQEDANARRKSASMPPEWFLIVWIVRAEHRVEGRLVHAVAAMHLPVLHGRHAPDMQAHCMTEGRVFAVKMSYSMLARRSSRLRSRQASPLDAPQREPAYDLASRVVRRRIQAGRGPIQGCTSSRRIARSANPRVFVKGQTQISRTPSERALP